MMTSLNGSNWVLGGNSHLFWPSGSPSMLPPVPHIEGGVSLSHPGGTGKISKDVSFDGAGAVKSGHDLGALVPHISVPPVPVNLYLAVIHPSSSCKAVWMKWSVEVNGTSMAVFHPMPAFSCALMMCGDPVKLPLGFVVDAPIRNTVCTELTLGDILANTLAMAFEMAMDALFKLVMKRINTSIGRRIFGSGPKALEGYANAEARAAGEAAAKKSAEQLQKNWLGSLFSQRIGYLLGEGGLRLNQFVGGGLCEEAIAAYVQKRANGVVKRMAFKPLVVKPLSELCHELTDRVVDAVSYPRPDDAILAETPLVE